MHFHVGLNASRRSHTLNLTHCILHMSQPSCNTVGSSSPASSSSWSHCHSSWCRIIAGAGTLSSPITLKLFTHFDVNVLFYFNRNQEKSSLTQSIAVSKAEMESTSSSHSAGAVTFCRLRFTLRTCDCLTEIDQTFRFRSFVRFQHRFGSFAVRYVANTWAVIFSSGKQWLRERDKRSLD